MHLEGWGRLHEVSYVNCAMQLLCNSELYLKDTWGPSVLIEVSTLQTFNLYQQYLEILSLIGRFKFHYINNS